MSVEIRGESGNKLEVNSDKQVKVNLPIVKSQAGYASMLFEQDAGVLTGSKIARGPNVSEDGRLSVGLDTNLAMYNFTALSQNTGDFKHVFSAMTMTQSGGFLNINPALTTVAANHTYLQTWRYFTLQGDGQLHVEIIGQISGMPPSNQVFEAGLFLGTAGVEPLDGVFVRLTSAGLVGVIAYNGVETTTGAVLIPTVAANTNGKYTIIVSQGSIDFYADGILFGTVETPAGNAVPYLTLNLPLTFQMRNSGTVVGGMTVKIGTAHVTMVDLNTAKPWAEQMASQGNAYQGQDGDTMGSLAIYSNAALAAAAALTNTTAAAGNTGLGGVALVLPTLTAGTDGILFSYLNPAGSTSQPPKTLIVTGISISAAVQVALTGGALTLAFGAAFNHTALSLATTESGSFASATSNSPRRVALGIKSAIANEVAGKNLEGDISVKFTSPLVIHPGHYFAITMRNVGTVTTLGALAVSAMVDHYFE